MATDEATIVDGFVMIKGVPREATKYAGENGGVWFKVDPEAMHSKWRKAGTGTAKTFSPKGA